LEIGSPVGVVLWPPPGPNLARTVTYTGVVSQTLRHYGVPYAEIAPEGLEAALPAIAVLITVGETADADLMKSVAGWVEQGGILIAVGGASGRPDLFGVSREAPAYSSWGGSLGMTGEGYLAVDGAHPVTDHVRKPLHFFNGGAFRPEPDARVLAWALDAHQRETSERAAVVETSRGKGRCLLVAPDVPGAIVRIRQGIAVHHDGVPAPDGTGPICDEVLKSGDGGVLDWAFDRDDVDGVPGFRAFLEPVADRWAELLVRAVLWGASTAGVRLPLLWLYPRNLPALALLTHDSDGNDPTKAQSLLRVLEQARLRSTWCVMDPGYPPETVSAILAARHEPAFHYDAMSDGTAWSSQEFARQYRRIADHFGAAPVTNKNHYLRWEGDLEGFEWCIAHGIRVDQSKGASKTGEAGFNFGSCHPYRPVRRNGAELPILEIPTPTQDLIVFAPPAIARELQKAVLTCHGIHHLLFHPAHIETAGVAEALIEAVDHARAAGMEWWTAVQVADWEEARLGCTWSRRGDAWEIAASSNLPDASVLWLDPDGPTERWGFGFRPEVRDITAGTTCPLGGTN